VFSDNNLGVTISEVFKMKDDCMASGSLNSDTLFTTANGEVIVDIDFCGGEDNPMAETVLRPSYDNVVHILKLPDCTTCTIHSLQQNAARLSVRYQIV
jgi:hypothetical protein